MELDHIAYIDIVQICAVPRATAPPLRGGWWRAQSHSSTNMEEATTSAERAEELVSKRKSSGSVIWRWFGFKVSDEQQHHVICRECNKQVTARGGSTTNLFHHLKQWHKLQYEESLKLRAAEATAASHRQPEKAPAPKQSSLQTSFSRNVPYEKKSVKWCTITKAVSYHIAKDMVPVATVEQFGFQKLLKTMDPRYELPSRNYFAREALPQMYTEIRQSLADRLANVTHFALTSDMWSSRTCEPYMSVTVHFIQDWEMKTACLQTSYFPQDHTGEHIAEALQDAIASWKLQEKYLVAITTDSGSNIVKAVELNEWLRMQCFGHRLHLAIGECSVVRSIQIFYFNQKHIKMLVFPYFPLCVCLQLCVLCCCLGQVSVEMQYVLLNIG